MTIDTNEVCNPPRHRRLLGALRGLALFHHRKPLHRSRLRHWRRLLFALRFRRLDRGGLLAIQLEDPFTLHRRDEEIGEGPHQRVDAVGRIAQGHAVETTTSSSRPPRVISLVERRKKTWDI